MIATRILPKKILLKQKWKFKKKKRSFIDELTKSNLYTTNFVPYFCMIRISWAWSSSHACVSVIYYAPKSTTHSIQTQFLQNSSYHLICFVHGICSLLCSTSMRIVLILFSTTQNHHHPKHAGNVMWESEWRSIQFMQFISSNSKMQIMESYWGGSFHPILIIMYVHTFFLMDNTFFDEQLFFFLVTMMNE